jgi:hypothetical protein
MTFFLQLSLRRRFRENLLFTSGSRNQQRMSFENTFRCLLQSTSVVATILPMMRSVLFQLCCAAISFNYGVHCEVTATRPSPRRTKDRLLVRSGLPSSAFLWRSRVSDVVKRIFRGKKAVVILPPVVRSPSVPAPESPRQVPKPLVPVTTPRPVTVPTSASNPTQDSSILLPAPSAAILPPTVKSPPAVVSAPSPPPRWPPTLAPVTTASPVSVPINASNPTQDSSILLPAPSVAILTPTVKSPLAVVPAPSTSPRRPPTLVLIPPTTPVSVPTIESSPIRDSPLVIPAPSPVTRQLQGPVGSVTKLCLINADTNLAISTYDPLVGKVAIDLDTLPTANFSIEAITGGTVSSLIWFYSGALRLESTPPWSFCGNNGPDFYACSRLKNGFNSTITAIPYAGKNATGVAGAGVTIDLMLFKTIVQPPVYMKLYLINADTGSDIGRLINTTVINVAETPNVNIRATVVPSELVASVKFGLNGRVERIENVAPYAFYGNHGPDYAAWTPSLGLQTVTASAFGVKNAQGPRQSIISVSFLVENKPSVPSPVPSMLPFVPFPFSYPLETILPSTALPTAQVSAFPTVQPTLSVAPSTSMLPSIQPTTSPKPSMSPKPSSRPSISLIPSTAPTGQPTLRPTPAPNFPAVLVNFSCRPSSRCPLQNLMSKSGRGGCEIKCVAQAYYRVSVTQGWQCGPCFA